MDFITKQNQQVTHRNIEIKHDSLGQTQPQSNLAAPSTNCCVILPTHQVPSLLFLTGSTGGLSTAHKTVTQVWQDLALS